MQEKFYHTGVAETLRNIKGCFVPVVLALLHWMLSIYYIFGASLLTPERITRSFIFMNVILIILMTIIYKYVFFVYRQYKLGLPKYKRGVHVFLTCLSIFTLLLIILWPGTWAWDDIYVVNSARGFFISAWQHVLSSIFHILCLQCLPFPAGVILIQNIIASVCTAFIIVKFESVFLKHIGGGGLLILLPFIMPPVLIYQFSGYRIGLYVHLEAVMLCILFCSIREHKEWSSEFTAFFCLLCAIVSTWRTESFIYIPIVCAAIIFMRNILTIKKKAVAILMIILTFFCIHTYQNLKLGNSNYKIVSTMCPLVEVIRASASDYSEAESNSYIMNDINRVLDLEFIYQDKDNRPGDALYWTGRAVRKDYTKEDYSAYINAFFKICAKYPLTVLHERVNIFLRAAGLYGRRMHVTNISGASRLFHREDENMQKDVYEKFRTIWTLNKPIFPELREKLIYFLGMQRPDGTELLPYRIVYNSLIPIVILIILQVIFLLKRKWLSSLILSAVNIKTILVFLTEPSPWVMYWLSQYYIGYIFFIFWVIIALNTVLKTRRGEN